MTHTYSATVQGYGFVEVESDIKRTAVQVIDMVLRELGYPEGMPNTNKQFYKWIPRFTFHVAPATLEEAMRDLDRASGGWKSGDAFLVERPGSAADPTIAAKLAREFDREIAQAVAKDKTPALTIVPLEVKTELIVKKDGLVEMTTTYAGDEIVSQTIGLYPSE